jgi:hypothetical protein
MPFLGMPFCFDAIIFYPSACLNQTLSIRWNHASNPDG